MKNQRAKIASFVAREPKPEALPIEERLRRADEAMAGSEPVTSPQPVTGPEQVTGSDVSRSPAEPVTRQQPVTGSEPVSDVVKQRKGYLLIPNTIVWDLFPELGLYARGVYEELYLWTHGFGENPRRVNQAECYKRLKISERQWRRCVEDLERRGLVERVVSEVKGPNDKRGTLMRVNVPDGSSGAATGREPVTGRQRVTGREPVHESKRNMKEKAPDAAAPAPGSVYDVRKRAATIYEARKHEPGFSGVELRAAVARELAGEGLEVAAAIVDEAVRGMG